jgi:thymidylate synthase
MSEVSQSSALRVSDEYNYLKLLLDVLENGVEKTDRTGIGTYSLFGVLLKFKDVGSQFPLYTTKKIHFRGIVEELLWILRGDTDARILQDKKIRIWDGNTNRDFLDKRGLGDYPEGVAGPIYGYQLRNFNGVYNTHTGRGEGGVDQLRYVIDLIKNNPNSRRIMFSLWNPSDINKMCLPPCHYSYVFNVTDGVLNCMMNMRSNDLFLGNPYNVASTSLLTILLAKLCGLCAGDVTISIADAHIYKDHYHQVLEQTKKIDDIYASPTVSIDVDDCDTVDDCLIAINRLEYNQFTLHNYRSHKQIKAKMAV